jgi:putative NADH-flavin reductase
MKFVVLGATGGTGLELIRLAEAQGHEVTAFLREPKKLQGVNGRARVIKGDLLNQQELETAIRGHDAVLSAFGQAEEGTWLRHTNALVRAMAQSGVRRAIILSVAFLFRDSIIPPAYLAGRLFFPKVVKAATEMEEAIEKSELEWTIVRPPELTNGPLRGKYRVREGHLPRLGFKISRADVADFMIKTVTDTTMIGKVVGVCD